MAGRGANAAQQVLLAQKYDAAKHDPVGWWMSEKLDGVRAYWDGSRFYSRQVGALAVFSFPSFFFFFFFFFGPCAPCFFFFLLSFFFFFFFLLRLRRFFFFFCFVCHFFGPGPSVAPEISFILAAYTCALLYAFFKMSTFMCVFCVFRFLENLPVAALFGAVLFSFGSLHTFFFSFFFFFFMRPLPE
jgi:hypothetical protein